MIPPLYALDDSLKLERAGRLIASTYVIGNPDEKFFGLHPDYKPSRPSDMIHFVRLFRCSQAIYHFG